MRTWLLLLVALMLTNFVACAPRQGKTHYARWAEETEKRKEEEAKEEAAQAAGQKPSGAKVNSTTDKTPPPPPPSDDPDFSSLPPGDTPTITRTATRSRVIKPEDKDDDVI